MKFLSKFEAPAYALLRFILGFLITCHGVQKLFGGWGEKPMIHIPLMLVAGIIEFGGGLLVAVGFQTRLAAFLLSGLLAVAYFTAHARGGLFPIMNGGELAVAYCFAFLYIATRGVGRWGIDKSSS
jgi:putative oxidoreductase